MKVRMLTAIAGHAFSHQSGEVVELAADEAEAWCHAGVAEPVEEVATKKAPAKRAARKPAKSD